MQIANCKSKNPSNVEGFSLDGLDEALAGRPMLSAHHLADVGSDDGHDLLVAVNLRQLVFLLSLGLDLGDGDDSLVVLQTGVTFTLQGVDLEVTRRIDQSEKAVGNRPANRAVLLLGRTDEALGGFLDLRSLQGRVVHTVRPLFLEEHSSYI